VAEDSALIARVARDFEAHEKGYGLTFVPFGKVRIVFFVNKGVGIQNLTSRQLADIYSGKAKDWKAVGGPAGKIRVVTREEGDSALETLEETLPDFEDIDITSRSKTVFTEIDALNSVETKAGAIGFGSYGYAENADVKILSIDGKSPLDTDYPSAHPVGLVFREKNRRGIIKRFVEFATSPDANDAIKRAGAAPL
jgi:phosphate transport system substrate-binding protein